MKALFKTAMSILVGCMAALACPAQQAPTSQTTLLQPAPEFSFRVTDTLGNSLGTKTGRDFLGKWLFIDFWTRSCIACITSMPKLSEFQGAFAAKANFLLVGRNDAKYNSGIQGLYVRIAASEKLRLFTAFDTLSFKRFNVQTTPHVVIIDPQGKIYAVTSSSELKSEKLQQLFSGEKVDFAPIYGYASPVIKSPSVTDSHLGERRGYTGIPYSSSLETWHKKDPMLLHLDLSERSDSKVFATNTTTLERLYLLAYLGKADWAMADSLYLRSVKKVELQLADTTLFRSDRLREKGLYNYRLELTGSKDKADFMQAMQGDLATRFGYRVRKKTVQKVVYQLKIADQALAGDLKSSAPERLIKGDASGYHFTCATVAQLLGKIGYFHSKLLFEDRTGIGFPIDISLPVSMLSLEAIRSELLKNGLSLVATKKEMQVIEISDR